MILETLVVNLGTHQVCSLLGPASPKAGLYAINTSCLCAVPSIAPLFYQIVTGFFCQH